MQWGGLVKQQAILRAPVQNATTAALLTRGTLVEMDLTNHCIKAAAGTNKVVGVVLSDADPVQLFCDYADSLCGGTAEVAVASGVAINFGDVLYWATGGVVTNSSSGSPIVVGRAVAPSTSGTNVDIATGNTTLNTVEAVLVNSY